MKIIAAQINPLVGAIESNAQYIINIIKEHHDADLIIFPELALTGYPPEDLLLRPNLYTRCDNALAQIKQATTNNNTAAIIGHPTKKDDGSCFNSASCIKAGEVIATYNKNKLPNYTVFDEKRYFTAGNKPCVFKINNINIGLIICEDLWFKEPALAAKQAGAELLISINASPFALNKEATRHNIAHSQTSELNLPLVYLNCVGGQDELVFDGSSFAMEANGGIAAQSLKFKEDIFAIEFNEDKKTFSTQHQQLATTQLTDVYQALVLGVRDYIKKNNFPGAIIGLSGGIDSALTLAIAADAIGGEKILGVSMPSRYTASMSNDDAKEQANKLNITYDSIAIEPMFQEFLKALTPNFKNKQPDTTEQNIQARIRGILLMALSNQTGKLVLSTGNKSEMAVGYTTIYGDMVGGFAVLKNIPKTMVYDLARYRNTISRAIPERVITRPPSAELAPNQKDQDSLPDYTELDAIINLYIDNDQSAENIISQGFNKDIVEKIIKLIKKNEYKRRQSPPGVRINERAFGKDRRYPITSGY